MTKASMPEVAASGNQPEARLPALSCCNYRHVHARLPSGSGWNVLLCEQMFKSLGEPQIRTVSRQYLRDAMLLRTTPMPDPALYRYPNAAGRFSVTVWNCCVVLTPDLRIRHGHGTATRHRQQGGGGVRQARVDAFSRGRWSRSPTRRPGPCPCPSGRAWSLRTAVEGSPCITLMNPVEARS